MWKTLFLLFLIFSFSLISQENMIFEKGPLHEAFFTQEYGTLIYPLICENPPASLQEKEAVRPHSEEEMIWVRGYWEWSEQVEDFVWVSGMWRLPPPEHHWIPGEWQKFEGGWARLPGFWSRLEKGELPITSQIPPDPIDEYIPPAPGENYFWILGHWEFDKIYQRYDWRQGRWQKFDSRWVYFPSHYLWRGEGFLFVEGYWDWPLEKRGEPYVSILVPEDKRAEMIYEPTVKEDIALVVAHYFPLWPNYLYFFHTFYYTHPEFWDEWGVHLPWWSWQEWWSFPWQDQLWLWWWWSHPGYPEPTWMTLSLSKEITPPSKGIKKMMKGITPLPNVTPKGIVGNEKILNILFNLIGRREPLFSENVREEIEKQVMPQEIRRPVLLPEGKEAPIEKPVKPFFGPKEEELESAPKRIIFPTLPTEKPLVPETPKIPRKKPAAFPHSNIDEKTPWPARFEKETSIPHSNVEGPKWPEQIEHEKRDEANE